MIALFPVFLEGFFLGASLIIAIGLQNAFILRQGLKNRHVFLSACVASFIDAALILCGVLGFGLLVESSPEAMVFITYGGVAFLSVYGVKSFLSAFSPRHLNQKEAKGTIKTGSARETVVILLGVSLLNPHVYLDTVILIGGLAAAYGDSERYIFGAGAVLASFVWFFSLAYSGRVLAPVFENPKAWRVLDVMIGFIMFYIAYGLLRH